MGNSSSTSSNISNNFTNGDSKKAIGGPVQKLNSAYGNGNDEKMQFDVAAVRYVTFWRDGFQFEAARGDGVVFYGKLKRYEHPESVTILKALILGTAPTHLLGVKEGQLVELRVMQRLMEDNPAARGEPHSNVLIMKVASGEDPNSATEPTPDPPSYIDNLNPPQQGLHPISPSLPTKKEEGDSAHPNLVVAMVHEPPTDKNDLKPFDVEAYLERIGCSVLTEQLRLQSGLDIGVNPWLKSGAKIQEAPKA